MRSVSLHAASSVPGSAAAVSSLQLQSRTHGAPSTSNSALLHINHDDSHGPQAVLTGRHSHVRRRTVPRPLQGLVRRGSCRRASVHTPT